MSDRVPKVTVDPYDAARWVGTCHEPDCNWEHRPDSKTYVKNRASVHRQEHRAKAAERD